LTQFLVKSSQATGLPNSAPRALILLNPQESFYLLALPLSSTISAVHSYGNIGPQTTATAVPRIPLRVLITEHILLGVERAPSPAASDFDVDLDLDREGHDFKSLP
jgi:hypothetical protein